MQLTQPFEYIGEHEGKLRWWTPSWTDFSEDAPWYTLELDPETMFITCDCFGARSHKMKEDMLRPGEGCKHARGLRALIRPFFSEYLRIRKS